MAKFKAKPIVIEAWYFGGGYFAAVDLVRKAGYDESHPNGEIAQYDESEFDLAFEPAGE